jgi:hypothetical protein
VLSVLRPQDRPPILGEKKEGAQPSTHSFRTWEDTTGRLVRYNNKVRINFFFETVERQSERWGELSDYEVRAASHILEDKREVGAWNN